MFTSGRSLRSAPAWSVRTRKAPLSFVRITTGTPYTRKPALMMRRWSSRGETSGRVVGEMTPTERHNTQPETRKGWISEGMSQRAPVHASTNTTSVQYLPLSQACCPLSCWLCRESANADRDHNRDERGLLLTSERVHFWPPVIFPDPWGIAF